MKGDSWVQTERKREMGRWINRTLWIGICKMLWVVESVMLIRTWSTSWCKCLSCRCIGESWIDWTEFIKFQIDHSVLLLINFLSEAVISIYALHSSIHCNPFFHLLINLSKASILYFSLSIHSCKSFVCIDLYHRCWLMPTRMEKKDLTSWCLLSSTCCDRNFQLQQLTLLICLKRRYLFCCTLGSSCQ